MKTNLIILVLFLIIISCGTNIKPVSNTENDKPETKLNMRLVQQLDSIYVDDQKYRMKLNDIEKKYGWESKEMKANWKAIIENDSVNLIKVKTILDNNGWLGEEIVGEKGSAALFLVIQHSNLATQEKYLPMLRDAVKQGKASGSRLALLEDRVALRQGKKQIYGSQISRDEETKLYYVSPLEDPDNVDKRRAEVGLQPIAKYVLEWQIKWDVEQYKKDLAKIEAKEKANQK
jgi:hypothetical protein